MQTDELQKDEMTRGYTLSSLVLAVTVLKANPAEVDTIIDRIPCPDTAKLARCMANGLRTPSD